MGALTHLLGQTIVSIQVTDNGGEPGIGTLTLETAEGTRVSVMSEHDLIGLDVSLLQADGVDVTDSEGADDLDVAIGAIVEVMTCDKGQTEDEWIEWCNDWLPLVQAYGYLERIVSFH